MKYFSFILAVTFLSMPAIANELSSTDKAIVENALRDTQKMLKDRNLRNAEINKSKKGQDAAKKLEGLGGSQENIDAMYSLASDIFESLVRGTNGNVEEMKKILEAGEKDPAEFAEKWLNNSLQERLNGISKNIQTN